MPQFKPMADCFERRIQSNLTPPYHRILISSCSSPSLGTITKRWSVRLVKMSLSEIPRPLRNQLTGTHYRLQLRPLCLACELLQFMVVAAGIVSGPVQLRGKPQDRATQPHPRLSNSFLRRERFSDGEGGCQSDGTSRSLPTMS
jgi:hypothetical protein